jgi:hypothetical protein
MTAIIAMADVVPRFIRKDATSNILTYFFLSTFFLRQVGKNFEVFSELQR